MRWLVLAVLFFLSAQVTADELETIDGETVTGAIEGIDPNGKIQGEGIAANLTLDALRSIKRDIKATPAKPKLVLETPGQGRLLAQDVTLADDMFTVTLADGKEVVLPLDAVLCLRFEPELEMASFSEALSKPSAEEDKIFVKVEKQIDAVSGLIVALSDKELTFEYDGEERKLPRERLHGIVLARTAEPKTPPASVQLANGSRLAGKVVALTGGELQLELQGGAKASVPFDSVQSIELRSPRLISVSSLEPTLVNEETILTLPRPWQRDRNVMGKPLVLGTRTYSRGLGVHAKSELVFDVPPGFDLFLATVGIDASVMGKGDCEFVVLGDGRELWSQRIKGSDPPMPVQVELKNVKKLTLQVNPGSEYDLGDHANWCDARFLKSN